MIASTAATPVLSKAPVVAAPVWLSVVVVAGALLGLAGLHRRDIGT